MKTQNKTKEQLIKELVESRERITNLEKSKAECKRIEEALQESEQKYETLVESATDSIFTISKDNTVLSVNQAAARVLGGNPEEITGKSIFDLFPEEIAKGYSKDLKEVFETGTPRHFETIMVARGRKSWISTNLSPLKDQEGNVTAVMGVPRDITERRRAEEELRKHRDRLEELVEKRTDELRRTNEQLQQDIAERKKTEEEIQQRADDMFLINLLNQAINRGDDLQKILHLLSKETKRIFSCDGVTLYLLDEDKKHLILQTDVIHSNKVKRRVEEIIGMKIPTDIKIPLKEGSLYQKTLQEGKPQLINDPATIQSFIAEFTENKMLKKLVPKIYRILGIESVINIPLISGHEVIGLMDISSNEPFTELALQRFTIISEQLTTIIKRKRAEEALQKSENEKTLILSSVSELVNYQDKELKIVWANRAAAESVGLSFGQVVGHYCYEVWHQRSEPCVGCPIGKTIETGQPQQGEMTTPDGKVWFIRGYPVRDENNNVVGAVEVTMDITERKQAEEALRESGEKYKTLTENINVGIYRNTVGPKGKFIEVNPAIIKMFGYNNKAEFLALDVADLYQDPKGRKKFNKKMLHQGFVKNEELRLKKKNGKPFISSVSAVAVKDEKGEIKYYDGMVEDITERKRTEEQLAYMATHDPLTGLPNRILFKDRLEQALKHAHRRGQTLAVMLLDLDHFKNINDTLGHSVGDQLLHQVASRLINTLRKGDTVGRMGGDEFMLLLPEIIREEYATTVAKKILEAVHKLFIFDGHTLNVTTSIGIALYPHDAENGEMLMRNADIAMYRAKDKGRNDYQRYSPTFNTHNK